MHTQVRIVSLAPSVTSILLELGAGGELVGVSKWCKDVADVGRRPQVGDCWKMDIEEVMRLKPTILIGSVPFAPGTVAKILAQPVTFVAINPRSLADIPRDIRILGRMVNRAANAEKLIRRMGHAFEAVVKAARTKSAGKRPRVYCEAWPKPRISSPPWVAELVEIAGGKIDRQHQASALRTRKWPPQSRILSCWRGRPLEIERSLQPRCEIQRGKMFQR